MRGLITDSTQGERTKLDEPNNTVWSPLQNLHLGLAGAAPWCYNQRGPLEYTFFRHFLRLVFGCINADFCVQGRIFQRFSSSHCFLCTIPDFSDFSGPLHHFSQNLAQFSLNFKRDSRFCKSLSKFHRFFSEFLQNFSDFDRIDVKMMIFRKNQRKLQKLSKNILQKFWKSVWKNVYSNSLRWW